MSLRTLCRYKTTTQHRVQTPLVENLWFCPQTGLLLFIQIRLTDRMSYLGFAGWVRWIEHLALMYRNKCPILHFFRQLYTKRWLLWCERCIQNGWHRMDRTYKTDQKTTQDKNRPSNISTMSSAPDALQLSFLLFSQALCISSSDVFLAMHN